MEITKDFRSGDIVYSIPMNEYMELMKRFTLSITTDPIEDLMVPRTRDIAGIAKMYESGFLSQDRAARLAGMSRSEFIDALIKYRVSPFQETAEEIIEEAMREAGHGKQH